MPTDHDTSIDMLKLQVQNFCEARDWDRYHNAKDLAIGISVETAELLEQFRYKTNNEIEGLFLTEENRDKITHEVADIFFLLLRFSQVYDIDLATELSKKMELNEKKYPVAKAKGSNKKYTEF